MSLTNTPILVTGGTGTLGRLVVPQLRAAGHDVRVLSRHAHDAENGIEYVSCDLLGGNGIDAAVAGVETVVHLAGANKGDDVATANLVRACVGAGVRHIVYISVIGADVMPIGWFRLKLAAERSIAESGVPYTILRAAQFHDLVLTMAEKMAKMPVVPKPGGLRFQPVDARDVADRIAELALGEPAGVVADIAGPTVYGLDALNRSYLSARGKHRPMMPVRIPGKAGKLYRAGENLTLEGATVGTHTWEEFLAERVA
jgi:uncharacterized protein YbjT (DUF2867 family)